MSVAFLLGTFVSTTLWALAASFCLVGFASYAALLSPWKTYVRLISSEEISHILFRAPPIHIFSSQHQPSFTTCHPFLKWLTSDLQRAHLSLIYIGLLLQPPFYSSSQKFAVLSASMYLQFYLINDQITSERLGNHTRFCSSIPFVCLRPTTMVHWHSNWIRNILLSERWEYSNFESNW